MDTLVNKLIELSKKRQFNALKSQLKEDYPHPLSTFNELKQQLKYFEMTEYTLVQLAILASAFKKLLAAERPPWEEWFSAAIHFFVTFDPEQVAVDQPRFFSFVSDFSRGLLEQPSIAASGLWGLLQAYAKLELRSITSLHTEICRLALVTRHLYQALPIIESQPTLIEAKRTGVTGSQLVLFFYYAGSVALVLKRYATAVHYYNLAVAVPCEVPHAASLEAAKKLFLVHLIRNAHVYSVPRYAASAIQKVVRLHADDYSKLATVFSDIIHGRALPAALNRVILEHDHTWKTDQTYGLVNQLPTALTKHRIKRLTRTFVTLSYSDVLSAIEEPNCIELIAQMAQTGELPAKLDDARQVITFEEAAGDLSVDEVQDACEQLLAQRAALQTCMRNVKLDSRFVHKTVMFQDTT